MWLLPLLTIAADLQLFIQTVRCFMKLALSLCKNSVIMQNLSFLHKASPKHFHQFLTAHCFLHD